MENKFSPDAIIRWIIIVTLGLTPIIFLPMTQDFYDTNKWMVLTAAAAGILLGTGILLLLGKRPLRVTVTSGTLAVGSLFVAAFVSLIFASTNKIEAIVNPLGVVTLGALTILVAAASGFTAKAKTMLTWGLYLGTGILNLIAIYQFFGMGKIMFPGLPFLQDALWTPSGATTTTIAVSLITMAILIPDILRTIKKATEHTVTALLILSLLVIGMGSALTVWQFIPKAAASLMPLSVAWTVTLEALKNTKAAAFGVGTENFLSAFTQGKPAALINTPLWNVRFTTNADFFLHVGTIFGLIGLAASLLFTYMLIQGTRGHTAARIAGLLALLLLPPTITILTVVAMLFVISEPNVSFTKTVAKPLVRYPAAIILLILAGSTLFGVVRYWSGERAYFQAILAAQKNEGTNTYNRLVGAIGADGFMSRYHITFSQVNLSLANSLSSSTLQTTTDKTPATQDKDRQMISQLIQQGISEAKVAVTLNPQSVVAWENLGNTYQAVMQIAGGSDAWAAASYQKALSLDPTNPVLMVNLGGVLVHEKKYDSAILAFNQAIFLKSDYANAYYNLANAYTLKGDTEAAKAALTKTMSLVAPDSADYTKVKNELDARANTNSGTPPPATSSGQTQLTLPQ